MIRGVSLSAGLRAARGGLVPDWNAATGEVA